MDLIKNLGISYRGDYINQGSNIEKARKSSELNTDYTEFYWTSMNPDVATVDNTGLVTGVGAGSATITVTMTVGGVDYSDSLAVTVTAAAATVVNMDILDTGQVAATKDGAGIVRLENILQHHGDMACTPCQHFFESFLAFVGDELVQKIK